MPAAWKPEAVAELLRLARAGDSWEAIGAYFYPQSANAWRAARSAAEAFRRHASSCDVAIRRRSLQRRNWNKLPGISERADRRRRKQHQNERADAARALRPAARDGALLRMTHRCPAMGCAEQLEEDWKVMCGSHWHLVPAELQKTLNRRDVSDLVRRLAVEGAVKAVERAEFGGRLL